MYDLVRQLGRPPAPPVRPQPPISPADAGLVQLLPAPIPPAHLAPALRCHPELLPPSTQTSLPPSLKLRRDTVGGSGERQIKRRRSLAAEMCSSGGWRTGSRLYKIQNKLVTFKQMLFGLSPAPGLAGVITGRLGLSVVGMLINKSFDKLSDFLLLAAGQTRGGLEDFLQAAFGD